MYTLYTIWFKIKIVFRSVCSSVISDKLITNNNNIPNNNIVVVVIRESTFVCVCVCRKPTDDSSVLNAAETTLYYIPTLYIQVRVIIIDFFTVIIIRISYN